MSNKSLRILFVDSAHRRRMLGWEERVAQMCCSRGGEKIKEYERIMVAVLLQLP